MFHDFHYPAILAASTRAAWQIDDVIAPGAALDFARPFMPENLARTARARHAVRGRAADAQPHPRA